MRKAVLAILLVLLASLPLALFPQGAVANGGVSMQTNAATDVDYFWATMNGQVTAFYGGCTVSEFGFVWSPVSHANPGNTVPWETAYVYDDHGSMSDTHESHGSPFAWEYGAVDTGVGAYLGFNTVFYYRAFVYEDAPYSTWVYGDEQVINLEATPEGCWPFYGWIENSYTTATTGAVVAVGTNSAVLSGSAEWSADPAYIAQRGFVWDTVSHANPSGWPDSYSDVNPAFCDYPNYVETWSESTWGSFGFSTVLYPLDLDTTYYYRAVVNRQGGGDWIYGAEETFHTYAEGEGCALEDNMVIYVPDAYSPNLICETTWVGQGISPLFDFSASKVLIDLYRIGSPSTVAVYVYEYDPFTWLPTGPPLYSGSLDVSSLTTDIWGEWVEIEFGGLINFYSGRVYAVVLEGTTDCEGSDFVVWGEPVI